MDMRNISPELREKMCACTSTEELVALAREEDLELADEQLEGVSGGYYNPYEEDPYSDLPKGVKCPKCGHDRYHWHPGGCLLVCDKCGKWF